MQSGNGRNLEAGTKLLKLALALYRKELSEQPDAEPSEAMLLLLQLANGDPELMLWATRLTRTSEDEVHRCCIAFIERELFATRTDPYGILGLNPWAGIADIKEHYRLLIRLFHPDRGLVNTASAEIYAAKINQAYSELKKLTPAGTGALSKPAPAVAFQAHRTPEQRHAHLRSAHRLNAEFETWGLLSWLTPAKVLFSIAILAILIVAVFFQKEKRPNDGHIDAIADTRASLPYFLLQEEPHDPAVAAESKPGALIDALPAEAPAFVEKELALHKEAAMQVKNKGLTPQAAPSKPKSPMTASVASTGLDDVQRDAVDERAVKPDTVVVQPAYQEIAVIKQTAVVHSIDTKAQSPVVAENPSVNMGVATANLNVAPSDRELHDLIAHFMSSYHRGDVSEFIQVFDERVRTDEPGGKHGLQNTYARFFGNTLSRSMVIKDLHWKRNGAFVIGQADYRASTLRAKDDAPVNSSGTLRFEVAKTGAGVSIVGFYHQAAKN